MKLSTANYKMVCYYGSWAVYRPGAGKFDVENIDPTICTHIVYGFTGLNYDNTMVTLDSWNDLYDNWGKGAMNRFVALKDKNPSLKVMVAIGGWNEGSEKYSKVSPLSMNRWMHNNLSVVACRWPAAPPAAPLSSNPSSTSWTTLDSMASTWTGNILPIAGVFLLTW